MYRAGMLQVRLLGTPDVVVGGKPAEVDTRKAIALLAYLAVERDASRDILTTLLWAEAPPDRARATLRRTLSSLRQAVGPDALVADRNRVTLTPGAEIDLDRFAAEIAFTSAHDHDPTDVCPDCIPHLVTATRLYRGDFLEGFSIRDAPEFEDWARTVAESLRLRMGDACHRLAVARASTGDYGGAIASTQRWIELDELHEPAHRLLMLLHAWAGDRPGAIEAYRNFVAIVDRELGVPPLEETTELYEAILDEDLPPAPGARRRIQADTAVRHASPQPTDLIDRRTELETLRSWWAWTPLGGRVGIVTGAAWMGKTRLVEEFSSEVSTSGYRVLTGRAFRTEQSLPFGVTVQILRKGAGAIDATRETIPPWAIEEVSRLYPGTSGTPAHEPHERSSELRLFEAIHETIAAISRSGPLLMVVDDVQWADPASVGLIGYLARRVADLPVLLVLISRSGEDFPPQIDDIRHSSDVLWLGPLSAADITDRAETDAAAIISHTGGVPLLVQERLERGDTDVSGSVASYLRHRMADLSELAGQVLSTAAVLAGTCDATLLREVSGRSEDEVVEAVEELVGAGLLREMPDGDDLGFTLDFLERTAYQSLSMVRRRLLHRRAAEAMASRPRAASDLRLAAAIAGQFFNAGDGRAGGWYRISGDLARAVHANDEARLFYETAISLDVADPSQVRLALGELAMVRGDYSNALRELTMAGIDADGPTLGLVEHRLGELHRLLGRFDIAGEHFARAVVTHPQPAAVHADWALLHHRLGNSESAREAAEEALRTASGGQVPGLVSRAQNVSGVVADSQESALKHLDRALDLAGTDELARMAAMNNKAHVLARGGDVEEAVLLVEQAIEIAASTGHRHHQAALHNHLADLHHQMGHTDRAAEELTRAVALFADVDAGAWEPEVWLLSRW